MPEGPEVKRLTNQLNLSVRSSGLNKIEILSGRYTKKLPEGFQEFSKLFPIYLSEAKCKGKFIYITTTTDWTIWNTLGMSGSWLLGYGDTESKHKHLRVKFTYTDTNSIYFKDMRNFGTLKFVKGKDKLESKLKSLGPDILEEEISDAWFKAKLMKYHKKTLPEVLMDQKVLAGIGNYIKAEALYLAKLSPNRTCASLSDEEIHQLKKAIYSVAQESYESGGSTFRTYSDFYGQKGNFSDRFMVYGKKVDPQGHKVVKTETKDKRTTHWVPALQK